MKNITVIGSCRVHEPMKSVSQAGQIRLNNAGTTGYVHSLGEIIQLIDYLRGNRTIPPEIVRFIPPEIVADIAQFSPILHKETDLFLIEVCSIKEFTICGNFVQMNLLFQELQRNGLEKDFYEFCSRMNASQGSSIPFYTAPNAPGASIAALEGISLTEDQVYDKVKDLQQKLVRPFAIVTHIGMPGRNDDPTVGLYRRSDGIRYLRNAGERLGVPVIEPGELVAGKADIMQNGSSNHYNPAWYGVVGEWILSKIQSRLI